MSQPTHFDSVEQAHVIGVGDKVVTHRVVAATDTIRMLPETSVLVYDGNARKGDVPGIARVATIQDSKRASDSTPLRHPLVSMKVAMKFSLDEASHTVRCTIRTETCGQTGVGTEALTAVQVGLLMIYDMCKAVDRGMVIRDVRLLEKRGGKSGDWVAD